MKLRKHMALIVAGSGALVLLVGALFLLIKFRGAYQRVDARREATTERLSQLYRRDPYPSDENVVRMQTNFNVLEGYFEALFKNLRKDQLEATKMEPAEFPLLLEKTIRRLHARAAESAVVLPPRFAFGFDRYAEGALPNATDVPRLVLQLRSIEELGGQLLESKIGSVISVQRTIFEQGAMLQQDTPAATTRRGANRFSSASTERAAAPVQRGEQVDSSGLFSREHYVLSFEGRDAAIWEALNALSRCKVFAVVSRVEFVNEAVLPRQTAVGAAAQTEEGKSPAARAGTPLFPMGPAVAAAPAEPVKKEIPSHEERVVAGREMVKAMVDVDVYRFLGEEPPGPEEAVQ